MELWYIRGAQCRCQCLHPGWCCFLGAHEGLGNVCFFYLCSMQKALDRGSPRATVIRLPAALAGSDEHRPHSRSRARGTQWSVEPCDSRNSWCQNGRVITADRTVSAWRSKVAGVRDEKSSTKVGYEQKPGRGEGFSPVRLAHSPRCVCVWGVCLLCSG